MLWQTYSDLQRQIVEEVVSSHEQFASKTSEISSTDSIDLSAIQQIMNQKYANVNDIDILRTVFNTTLLIHRHSSQTEGIPFLKPSIAEVFKHIRVASKDTTTEGFALLSSFKNRNNEFILKTNRNSKDNSDILYEYFIGTYGLNQLRKIIPNFCYTLGIFKCNPLAVEKTERVKLPIEMCKRKGNRYYVIYERIPGKTLSDLLPSLTAKQFVSYLTQIVLSLQIAYEKIGFVHYDLHPGNIIIRPLDSPQTLEYKLSGSIYRVETDAIATFIDYGYSHFEYEGIQFGGKDIPEYAINPIVAPGGFDLHRLLCYCIYSSLRNIPVYQTALLCYKYFKTDPYEIIKSAGREDKSYLVEALDRGYIKYFFLPETDFYYRREPIQFIQWMERSQRDTFYSTTSILHTSEYPPNRFLDMYRGKLEGLKIHGKTQTQSLNTTGIDRDYKSVVVNRYKIGILTDILTAHQSSMNPDDVDMLREKIASLDQITTANTEEYTENDKRAENMFNRDLEIDPGVDVREIEIGLYNYSLDELRTRFTEMSKLREYCELYRSYSRFSGYSRYSNRVILNPEFQQRYYQYSHLYTNFTRRYSELVFNTLKTEIFPTTPESLERLQYAIHQLHNMNTSISENIFNELNNNVITAGKTLRDKFHRDPYLYPQTGAGLEFVQHQYAYRDPDVTQLVDTTISRFVKTQHQDEMQQFMKHGETDFYTKFRIWKNYVSIIADRKNSYSTALSKTYTNLRLHSDARVLDLGGVDRIVETFGVNESQIQKDVITEHFPYTDNAFHLIVVSQQLESEYQFHCLLSECNRLLRPGGAMAWIVGDASSNCCRMWWDILDGVDKSQSEIDDTTTYWSPTSLFIHDIASRTSSRHVTSGKDKDDLLWRTSVHIFQKS
jgi:hypothetical protein